MVPKKIWEEKIEIIRHELIAISAYVCARRHHSAEEC